MLEGEQVFKTNDINLRLQKSKVLTAVQVHYLLKYSTQSSNNEDTLMGVCTALQYYGLLRISNTLKVVTEGAVEV